MPLSPPENDYFAGCHRYVLVGRDLARETATVSPSHSRPLLPPGAYIVTGGLGAIGRRLVQLLLEELDDCAVLVIGRKSEQSARIAELWHGSSRISYASVDLGADEAGETW